MTVTGNVTVSSHYQCSQIKPFWKLTCGCFEEHLIKVQYLSHDSLCFVPFHAG